MFITKFHSVNVKACMSDSCINFKLKYLNTQSPHLFTRAYLPKTGESIHRPFVYSHTHILVVTLAFRPHFSVSYYTGSLCAFYIFLFHLKMCKNETSAKVLFGCFNTVFFVSHLFVTTVFNSIIIFFCRQKPYN